MRFLSRAWTATSPASTPARTSPDLSLERMAALYDSLAVGVLVHDATGAIVHANPAAVALLGVSASRLRGRTPAGTLWQAVREDGTSMPDRELPALVALRTRGRASAVVAVGAAGMPPRWLRIDAAPVPGSAPAGAGPRDAEEGPAWVVSTLQDVTALKESQRQAMALARHDNLRAIGEMAGGVAHDLSKWLTLIAGHGELALLSLQRAEGDVAPIAATLDTIVKAAWDGTAMLKRIATFARSGEGESPELIDLGDLLREIAQLTAPKWRDSPRTHGKPIRLHLEVAGETWVEGLPGRLRETFANLIFNAVDAMPEGGTILVVAARRGGMVEASVTDNGTGMPPEVAARAFEPFFTTKGEQGTGLGLALVAGVVEQHGGRAAVESAPGLGTTIRIALPAAPERVAPVARGRVLAVDAHPETGELVKVALAPDGWAVDVVSSGEAALERLAAAEYAVVVADLAAGDRLSGWQFADAVRTRYPAIRFILLTGWPVVVDAEQAQRLGVADVIARPFTPTALREAVAGR